jgi:23S rRNA pseudouridine1911/1915/1917 synthase
MNKGVRKETRPVKGALPIQNPKKIPPELQVFAVHRLDRNTSGLMLFARTRQAEHRLVGMFRRHTIQREYVAVCHGIIAPQTIESMLVRDRGDGLRGSLPANPTEEQLESAERAVTHILGSKPIAGGAYSLLRLRLETGRTHQIRIHLSEAGHRLCGEPMYNLDTDGNVLADASQAPRQALHSDRLVFTHPITGQHMKFEMPWPKELANWIRSLGE